MCFWIHRLWFSCHHNCFIFADCATLWFVQYSDCVHNFTPCPWIARTTQLSAPVCSGCPGVEIVPQAQPGEYEHNSIFLLTSYNTHTFLSEYRDKVLFWQSLPSTSISFSHTRHIITPHRHLHAGQCTLEIEKLPTGNAGQSGQKLRGPRSSQMRLRHRGTRWSYRRMIKTT